MRPLFYVLVLLAAILVGVVLGVAAHRTLSVNVNLPPGLGALPAPTPTRGIDAAPRATPDAARGEAVVEITEADLENELNTRLVGQPLGSTPVGEATAESFAASLRSGQVEIGGWARIGPARVPFTVVGRVTPEGNGRPIVRVTDARLSEVPLPEAARGRIEQNLQAELDRQVARHPVRVRSVEIGGGRLRIIGTPTG